MTPYYYSTYEEEDETRSSDKERILILGGGPNRIGQGIEFDYCCCHASYAVRELGYMSIMMNCNPETVSTDYDTSDRLYFDPLTVEDVLSVIERENPSGVIVQFGGQTPLNISKALHKAGVRILGTSYESIARAEDRRQFSEMMDKLGLRQTVNDSCIDLADAIRKAEKIGYPVLMRPSFVLGGAKMAVVNSHQALLSYWAELAAYAGATDLSFNVDRPVLIDKFLQSAKEIDVDAISDGRDVYVAGIMEHIEEAGIHSGDSACVLPPFSLSEKMIREIEDATRVLALELGIQGLMNVQFATKDDLLYVLEVNPRASRTVPFVSKVTGVPIVTIATKLMLGHTLDELEVKERPHMNHFGVKGPVFPWTRFPGVDIAPGPEMKSTGEVMGIDENFHVALIKSLIAANMNVSLQGTAFVSVKDDDKPHLEKIVHSLDKLGFHIVATRGTAAAIRSLGIPATIVNKVSEGTPNIADEISKNKIQLIINTPSSRSPEKDEIDIRTTAVRNGIMLIMSQSAAEVYLDALHTWRANPYMTVKSIQDYHSGLLRPVSPISQVFSATNTPQEMGTGNRFCGPSDLPIHKLL